MARKSRSTWGSNKPARRKGYRTLRYWADLHDGRGYMRHTKTIAGSRRDGDEELARLRTLHSSDERVPTVRDMYERYFLPDIAESLSGNSIATYMSAWNSKVNPRWGDVCVTGVKPVDIQDWLSGFTKSQAAAAVKVMAQVMDYAVMFEYIDANPMRAKYRMPKGGSKRDGGIYTLDEAVEIFHAVKGSCIESAIIFSLFGSCRVGESISPKVSEISFSTSPNGLDIATFDLVRQVGKGGEVSGTLKTEDSRRTIVLCGEVARRVAEIARDRESSGLIWMCDNGLCEPMGSYVVSREWRKLTESLGIEYHLFKNLRNSWRTFMAWDFGIAPDRLEKMMGHKGSGIGEQYYNRPVAEMFIDAVSEAYESKGVLI